MESRRVMDGMAWPGFGGGLTDYHTRSTASGS